MTRNQEPVVLELAPLPREQIGPFLILGLDKGDDMERIEAHWARRVIWARKQQLSIPLEDVNWAREMLRDPQRRVRADVGSLNTDITGGALRQLADRHGAVGEPTPTWQPLDVEESLADCTPAIDIPDLDRTIEELAVPDPPADFPAVPWLIEQMTREPLDPWDPDLLAVPPQETAP